MQAFDKMALDKPTDFVLMRTARPNLSSLPLLSILAFTVIAIAGLLIITERAGLPPLWVERMVFAVIALTLATAAIASGTTQEERFFGTHVPVSAFLGGCVLGTVIVGSTMVLVNPKAPTEWLAIIVGSVVGVVSLHLALRLQPKPNQHLNNTSLQGPLGSYSNVLLKVKSATVARGVALTLLGFALSASSLVAVLDVLNLRPELSTWATPAVVLVFPVITLLSGGLRAGLTLTAAFALFAIAGLSAMVGTGLATLGDLPLPGFSEANTITTILETRVRLGIESPLFFDQWPRFSQIFDGEALRNLMLSAVVAAALASCLTPAIPVRRRSLTLATVGVVAVLPIAIVAVGGYAIEAAALQFFGSTVVKPPQGLLESARLGMVTICGGSPVTAEAMRVACGVLPRDASVLGLEQLKISQEFLRSGLPIAQGYPTVVNALGYCVRLALVFSSLTVGLWMVGKGLGQDILARHHTAPGLASFRLALTRLAVCIAGGELLVLSTFNATLTSNDAATLIGALAFAFLVLQANIQRKLYWSYKKTQQIDEKPQKPSRRKRIEELSDGKQL
jgi:hypothetical protein